MIWLKAEKRIKRKSVLLVSRALSDNMGMVLEKYVEDPKKRAILGWAKTLIIIAVFILVAQYFISVSTYQQGFEDCKRQVAVSLGQKYVDSIFPDMSNYSIGYEEINKVVDGV